MLDKINQLDSFVKPKCSIKCRADNPFFGDREGCAGLAQRHRIHPRGTLPGLLGMTLMMAGAQGIIGNQILTNRVVGYFPRRRLLVL